MQSLEIFFSYSHKDEALRDQLAQHLSILERQAFISSWHDRKIAPGEEWDHIINNQLENAQIILLLVSADFVASEYCYDLEVKRAMERYEAGQAKVIPVILRPVDWTGTPFSKLQALPKDGKPVTTWSNQDEAFVDIAQGIRATVETLVQIRQEKLQEYEKKYFEAIRQTFPVKDELIHQLDDLQKTLGLQDCDIIPIEERYTTPITESRQKSLRYRQEAQHLIEMDKGELSVLNRTILNSLQQSLGLSHDEANHIEEQIAKPFSLKKESQKQYEQAFSEVIKLGLPISESSRESLERFREILKLSLEDVTSIEEMLALGIIPSEPDDEISQNLNIDCTQLRDLLKAGKFKEADLETYLLILKAVKRESGEWIRAEDLKKFPSKDLKAIDNLWKKYSNDRFGFSIQKQVYAKAGSKGGTDNLTVFQKFGDCVGWRVNGEWLLYDKLTFGPSAPEGHLPGWFGSLLFFQLMNTKL